jgi:hypothetical protein
MTLERLNELRARNGMKPLKAWKESKQKLYDAIHKLEANTDATDQDPTPDDVPAESIADLKEVVKAVEFDEPTASHHTLTMEELGLA